MYSDMIDEVDIWDQIVEQIGDEPLPEHFDDTPEGLAEFGRLNDTYRRAISKTDEFKLFANERIERGQRASSADWEPIYWIYLSGTYVNYGM